MAETKRKTLNISEKVKVLDRLKDGDARETIMRDTGIAQRTLQRIIANEDEIRKSAATFSPSTKRKRTGKYDEIDDAIGAWFESMTELCPFVGHGEKWKKSSFWLKGAFGLKAHIPVVPMGAL